MNKEVLFGQLDMIKAAIEWELPIDYCVTIENTKKIINDSVSKEDIKKARNEIWSASLGRWYVGRTDGQPEEVVLMDDVLKILGELIDEQDISTDVCTDKGEGK